MLTSQCSTQQAEAQSIRLGSIEHAPKYNDASGQQYLCTCSVYHILNCTRTGGTLRSPAEWSRIESNRMEWSRSGVEASAGAPATEKEERTAPAPANSPRVIDKREIRVRVTSVRVRAQRRRAARAATAPVVRGSSGRCKCKCRVRHARAMAMSSTASSSSRQRAFPEHCLCLSSSAPYSLERNLASGSRGKWQRGR